MRKAYLRLAPLAADQARSRQYRAGWLAKLAVQFVEVVGRLDLQLHAKVIGKTLDQLILEAGLTIAVLEIGGGAVTGDHAQHTVLLDALQGAGFFNTGTEHQEESGCDEPSGAALAQSSLGEHSLQYTQRTGLAISRQRFACLLARLAPGEECGLKSIGFLTSESGLRRRHNARLRVPKATDLG
ncbi:hypothetical protein D3C81_1104080 [compost metagenome]